MSEAAIGKNGEKVIIFYAYKDDKDFKSFKESTEKIISPSILTSTTYIIFLTQESQRNTLSDLARFEYLTKKSFNFFGQIKDQNLKEKLKQKFDVLLVLDEVEHKYVKLINKISATRRIIGSESKGLKFDIRLYSSSNRIEQITSFAKETIEKIQA